MLMKRRLVAKPIAGQPEIEERLPFPVFSIEPVFYGRINTLRDQGTRDAEPVNIIIDKFLFGIDTVCRNGWKMQLLKFLFNVQRRWPACFLSENQQTLKGRLDTLISLIKLIQEPKIN